MARMALPIEDYALIGDRHTAALVGRNGSIDWLCLPRFDSPACFAGAARRPSDHGHWLLVPGRRLRRRPGATSATRPLLETTFTTDTAMVTLLDVMPTGDGRADVVRRVTGVAGTVRMRHEWVVRCDYGQIRPGYAAPTIGRRGGHRRRRRPRPAGAPRPPAPPRRRRPARRRVRRRGGRGADLLDHLGRVVRDLPRADRLGRPDRGDPCQDERMARSCDLQPDVPHADARGARRC